MSVKDLLMTYVVLTVESGSLAHVFFPTDNDLDEILC